MTVEEVLLVLNAAGLRGEVRSQNVVLACPFAAISGHSKLRDSHPSLGILPTEDGGVWNCFSCGRKGPIRKFLTDLESELGVLVDAALKKLDKILEKDPLQIAESVPQFEAHYSRDKYGYPVFPETWLAPYVGKIPRYVLDRGVSLETAKRWELGFDKAASRVFFPVRDTKKNLVGAVGRLTHKVGVQPRSKNYWHKFHNRSCQWPLDHRDGRFTCGSCGGVSVPETEVSEGFQKKLFCYGEHLVDTGLKNRIAVIVEGTFDAIRVDQACRNSEYFVLALLGAKASVEQVNRIVQLTGRKAVAFLDNDLAGIEGERLLRKALSPRIQYLKVNYHSQDASLDPGSYEDLELREMIEAAELPSFGSF